MNSAGSRKRRTLLRTAVTVIGVLVGVVTLLHVDGVATWVVDRLADRLNPYPGTRLAVARAELDWPGQVRLRDLSLVPDETGAVRGPELTVELLDVQVALGALLSRTIELRAADLAGATISVAQSPDSTWDITAPFVGGGGGDDDAEEGEGGWRFRTGPIRVERARIAVSFAPRDGNAEPERLAVEELSARVDRLSFDDNATTVRLETLYTRFIPPGDGPGPVVVQGRATLEGGRLSVPELTLSSESSDLVVRGTLLLPGAPDTGDEPIDFSVSAAPLSLQDISGFVRTVDPEVEVTGTAAVRGQRSRSEVEAHLTLSGGGAVDVEGELAPLLGGVDRDEGTSQRTYELRASVEGLQLESLLGEGPVGGSLTGSFGVDLSGPDASRLSGEVNARLEGLQIVGRSITRTTLSGTLADGAMELDLTGGAEGLADAALHVTGRPLDSSPTVAIEGDVRQLPGDSAEDGPREDGPREDDPLRTVGLDGLQVHVSTRLEGGFSPEALTSLSVQTLAGTLRGQSLAGGRATWEGATGNLRIDQPLGAGRLTASGTVADPWSGPLGLSVDARVQARDLVAGNVVVDSATFHPRLRSGSLASDLEARLDWTGPDGVAAGGGHVVAALSGRPFDEEPTFSLDSLRFGGADLFGLAPVATDLSGTAVARLEGVDPKTAELSARATLDSSSIGAVTLEGGDVVLTLSSGRLEGRIELRSGAGVVSAQGYALPFDPLFEAGVDEALVQDLDLAGFLGEGAPETDLNVALEIVSTGRSWVELDAVGALTVLPSTVRKGMITGGRVNLAAAGGRATADGELTAASGRVIVAARAEGLERPDGGELAVEVELPDFSGFLGLTDTLGASGTARVEWQADSGLDFSTALRGRTPYGDVDALVSSGSLARSVLRLDSLLLSSEVIRAEGGGSFPLGDAPAAPGETDLEIAFELFGDVPSFALPLLGLTAIDSGEGRVRIGGTAGARRLAATLEIGPWRSRRVAGGRISARAEYGSDGFLLDLAAPSVRDRDTLAVVLRGRHRAEDRAGTLEQLDVSTPEATWSLSSPVPYALRDDVTIESLELTSELGSIQVDGTVGRVSDHDLTVGLRDADLSWLGTPLDLEDLRLVADGDLRLSGNGARPVADATLELLIGFEDAPPGTVDADVSLEDGQASVALSALDPSGGELTLTGTAPLAGPGDPDTADAARSETDLELSVVSFDVSWLGALVPRSLLAELGGELNGNLTARGQLDTPTVDGNLTFQEGTVVLTSGPHYEAVNMAAAFLGSELVIESLRAESSSGSALLQGRVGLDGLRPDALDLTGRFDRFVGWRNPALTVVVTGDVTVLGSVDEPLVEGSVMLDGSRLNIDDLSTVGQAEAVELTEEDYRMLEEYFGYSVDREEAPSAGSPLDRLGLALSVQFDRDVWITRFPAPRLSLECRGDVRIEKAPGGEMSLVGSVEVLPQRSYFRQFGRRFAVDEGVVTLNGDPAQYTVNASARWEVPSRSNPNDSEVVVVLGVSGTSERLDLTLSSEPQMDESEIVSYLATGGAAGMTNSPESGLGTAMALGAASGALESFAADRVPLDVIEIANDPVRGTTLIAGRYVRPDLYLGFRQPVTFGEGTDRQRTDTGNSEAELEYQWFRWLTTNLQGSVSELKFFFRSRHAY